eukprot:30083_1
MNMQTLGIHRKSSDFTLGSSNAAPMVLLGGWGNEGRKAATRLADWAGSMSSPAWRLGRANSLEVLAPSTEARRARGAMAVRRASILSKSSGEKNRGHKDGKREEAL